VGVGASLFFFSFDGVWGDCVMAGVFSFLPREVCGYAVRPFFFGRDSGALGLAVLSG